MFLSQTDLTSWWIGLGTANCFIRSLGMYFCAEDLVYFGWPLQINILEFTKTTLKDF